MTTWILQQELTSEQEGSIRERTHLALPFEDLPDLTGISSPTQARVMLRKQFPEDPPETTTRRFDRFWNLYAALHSEDIIAVPLQTLQAVALAEITGNYCYQAVPGGPGIHQVPVKWYPGNIPLRKFGKHAKSFGPDMPKMAEVMDAETRIAIRDWLPHSYNRFARWKWLLIVFFILNMISMFMRKANMH